MSRRAWNFSPGPAMLPGAVLEAASRAVLDADGAGMSILEISHRSQRFEAVIREAEAGLRELLAIDDRDVVLFCQGGASLQFSMAPMNLLRGPDQRADYLVTGAWGAKAAAEARRLGEIRVSWDGAAEGYGRVPSGAEVAAVGAGDGAAFVHMTSNETIHGVQWTDPPAVGAPIVCDASSDLLSRPLDPARYGVVYAGAQKNAGTAGVTIVIVRADLLAPASARLPSMLDYRTLAEHRSMYNTPPVFGIYVVMLVTRWLRDEIGGLDAMAALNEEKASMLYDAIDASEGFYRGHAHAGSRSRMNVTWRLATEELERSFIRAASGEGLHELQGHRSVGGVRASIYNAMPLEGVDALRAFMERFRRRPPSSPR